MSPKSHRQTHYNVALVDKLWNLKRLCESQFKMHIPLNMVLKDEEYRGDLLEKALVSGNEELVQLVWDVRQMEDEILFSHKADETFKPRKKNRYAIKVNLLGAVACALLLVCGGYLLRSFVPVATGHLFALDAAVAQVQAGEHKSNRQYTGQQANQPMMRIHGSNTLGEKLTPRLVEAYLTAQGASNITTEPGVNPGEKVIRAQLNGRNEFVEVHAHGSSTAFTGLAEGKADMGMASRRIKTQERDSLREKLGDLTEAGSEQIVGLDGLAIVTHPSNPVSQLSLAQLLQIFSGSINNWSQVGGRDMPISLYARDEASGTWDSFRGMVLDPAKASLAPSAIRFESSTRLSDSVARDEQGIGFIGLPYVRRTKLIAIAAGEGSRAILPTHFTISTEDYPLARRLYFYVPLVGGSGDTEDFVRFSNSEQGQSLVEEVGFVSQNIKANGAVDSSLYPDAMRDLTLRSQRLSLNFRFRDGSDELDSKALADLERLVKYVEVNSPKRLQLFGFSDSEGNASQATELSLRRAKVVEEQLIRRGIYPLVARGMGDEAPLANSDSEAGRYINRRVEVWIL